jgi:hypothetical protein
MSTRTGISSGLLLQAQGLWRAFLLKGPERRVAKLSVAQSRTIHDLYDAGRSRDEAARELLDEADVATAGELARSAANFYVWALLAERVAPFDLEATTPEAAWAEIDRRCAEGEAERAPPDFLRARSALSDPDPSAWGRRSLQDALAIAQSFPRALDWLRRLVEPRSLAVVRYERYRRVAVGLLLLAVIAWWGLDSLFGTKKNLALRHPVTLSSSYAASTAPATGVGLVDGTVEQTYGIHTGTDKPSWVMVDLGAPHKISRVKIYNRGEGWFDDCLPMILQFSDNATDFVDVDRRTQSFSQFFPWTFDAKGRSARYVRVQGSPGRPVVLSELEVYGR